MTDRARKARAALMQLTTELLTENEDLEHRLHEALAMLTACRCADCMGTRTDLVTRLPCAWCRSIDALRLPTEETAPWTDLSIIETAKRSAG